MPIPQIPPLNQDADLEQIKTYVIRLERTLNFLLENGLDSENMFEVGGWRVKNDTLASKDGDVGLTTSGSNPDDIRLWAGSTDPDNAPWRVTKEGKMYTTGAVIQSSDGYPRVEMNPDENLFGAYSAANNYLTIQALPGTAQSPQLIIAGPSSNLTIFVSGLAAYVGATGADVNITTDKNIRLVPGANIYDVITPFDQFKDSSTNQTLQVKLMDKANKGSQTATSGSSDGGIPIGTVLRKADGGTVTWTGVPSHSHTQN
ncbi:hypothetical protein [Paenibacillus amylolyticus]|uniref:hypothetical protein n=1 Tax=Paenibacillus amylolyticus TaxID=1451 RepID=UPI00096E6022|nr:hypothetical protein [Paenibacillus amylolyticus]OMF47703.1 hypothetical protein BK136_02090 [Paenibacillus amylolyticus]